MLDKRLQLGGLQVGGPRTSQTVARFKVADNVYQTRDGYMIPRYAGASYLPSPDVLLETAVSVARYKSRLFQMYMDGSNVFFPYDEGTAIPKGCQNNPNQLDYGPDNTLAPNGPMYVEKLGCLYYTIPFTGLMKYDGTQYYKAGVPLPYFGCAQYAAAGTTFIRVIQHHIDMQGNIVNSGYIEFPSTPVGNNITLRVDSPNTDILDGSVGISPSFRPSGEILNGDFDERFFVCSTYAKVGNNIVFTTGGDHNVTPGVYILVSEKEKLTAATGLPTSYGIAMKVVSSNATTVTCDLTTVRYLDVSRQWVETDVSATPGTFFTGGLTITKGVNHWMSVWSSTSATANYVLKGVIPSLYDSASPQNLVVSVASPTVPITDYNKYAFNLSGNMGDIYDVVSSKRLFQVPNANSGFTTYQEMGLISYDTEIYFSDTTLGGAFEMTNGLAFIVVGDADDGVNQAICGNSDFLFVSRQYKNYYVSGNLVTANYRVQEISLTNLGAYSAESAIAVNDKIIFINKQGVWGVFSGGRCEELSENIQGFFDNYSNTTKFPEEEYFDIDDYPTYCQDVVYPNEQWIRVRLDTNRGLVIFATPGDGALQILVLNLNNGEFYTWHDMLKGYSGTGDPRVKDLTFINGSYYITANRDAAAIYKEDKVIPRAIPYSTGDYPPTLISTWFTAGEPSLEKKILQLKMWGIMDVDAIVNVAHSLDWQSDVVEDGSYENTSATLFSHKHRLASSNAQAVSVSMRILAERFELEGLELEFQPFQMGMKK